MMNWIWIGIGGFAGSLLRYAISLLLLPLSAGMQFPFGTLSVNALGSLLIGVAMAMGASGSGYFLCVVGFCGGFTTFSTFSLETVTLLRTGHTLSALLYIGVSLLASLLCVVAGLYLGEKLAQRIF